MQIGSVSIQGEDERTECNRIFDFYIDEEVILLYEYKFIRIDLSWGIFKEPKEDYHDVIREQGKDGWRLVQVFAPATSGYGKATFYELIFEKETK